MSRNEIDVGTFHTKNPLHSTAHEDYFGRVESGRPSQTSQIYDDISPNFQHIPSQQTLNDECQETIEGARSPVSDVFQHLILNNDNKSPQNFVTQS